MQALDLLSCIIDNRLKCYLEVELPIVHLHWSSIAS